MAITSLPLELLSAIFIHLPRQDLAALLRVNRRIHEVAERQLWRTLYLSGSSWDHGLWSSDDGYADRPLDARGCRLLVGSGGLGVRYTRQLRLLAKALKEGGGAGGVLDMVRGRMEGDEARVTTVEIVNLNTVVQSSFISYLKTYGSSKACRFSIELRRAFASSLVKFCTPLHQALDLELLGALDLEFRLPSPEQTADAIIALAGLLSAASNLQRLQLEPTAGSCSRYSQLRTLTEPLERLQSAVEKLCRLRYLDVNGTLFHPSFFLAPPGYVTRVRYRGGVSIAWWRRFAGCPFAGVREMQVQLLHVGLFDIDPRQLPSWADSGDEELSMAMSESTDDGVAVRTGGRRRLRRFWLRDVAVRGLEVFRVDCEGREELVAPADLVECVVRRNPGLARGCVNQLAHISSRSRSRDGSTYEGRAALTGGEGTTRCWWPRGIL
ncbi:hypothetical protein TWF696_001355 [Orbilia brochopaga]|uniref:F-box domain-containing protein n=1 Tax=Orbilia brochopaga TaxID=3140254 RepID=A0AAV9UA39_9PEZI